MVLEDELSIIEKKLQEFLEENVDVSHFEWWSDLRSARKNVLLALKHLALDNGFAHK